MTKGSKEWYLWRLGILNSSNNKDKGEVFFLSVVGGMKHRHPIAGEE
jgi:hypothetical protein